MKPDKSQTADELWSQIMRLCLVQNLQAFVDEDMQDDSGRPASRITIELPATTVNAADFDGPCVLETYYYNSKRQELAALRRAIRDLESDTFNNI